MKAIKYLLLGFRNKFQKISEQVKRFSVSYEEAKKIGVLFTVTKDQSLEAIEALIQKFKKEGKKTEVLFFFEDEKLRPEGFKYPSISAKDITLLGQIKSPVVDKFVNIDFDFLYCVSFNKLVVFEEILQRTKAKCRVGQYFKHKNTLFEMMIKVDPRTKVEFMVDDMLMYTRSLQTFSYA